MWLMRSLLSLVAATCLCGLKPRTDARSNIHNERVSSLGVTVQLHCSNSTQYQQADLQANGVKVVSWMLPDLSMLRGNSEAREGRLQLVDEGWTLKIVNVSRAELGVFQCLLRYHDDSKLRWLVLRPGLNVGGPFFENAWNKYRPSTVRAFVTSLVFVFVAVAACLVYRFRYRSLRTADSDELPCPPSGDNGGGSTKIRDDRMAKVKHPSNDWVMGMQLSRGSTLPCPHSSATDDAYPADMEVNQQRSIQFTTHL